MKILIYGKIKFFRLYPSLKNKENPTTFYLFLLYYKK
jgi:hypothetical protein